MLSKSINKSILSQFFSFILNDLKENKKYHIFLLVFIAIVFLSFKFILAHDDLVYYYGSMNFKDEFIYKFVSENRIFYPIIVAIINKLYLSPKIVLLFGFILFYINNFVLIKLFFPKITTISYIFISLIIIVNPFNIYLIRWSTVFFSMQLGILAIFLSYYVFMYSNLKKYLKIFFSAIAICFSIQIIPPIFYTYITLILLSVFYKFLLDDTKSLKILVKENYIHIIYILLGIVIFYIIDRLLLLYFNVEHNYGDWRGEYLPVNSLSIFFSRIKNTFLHIKNDLPIYLYSITILNIVLLVYSIMKRVYFLSFIFFCFVFVLLFIPYISNILINIHGTLVALYSIHYLMAILFLICLNILNKCLTKILYVVLSVYILISVSLIDRYSKVIAVHHRVNTYIYDKIELESMELNPNNDTKIYIYGNSTYLFSLFSEKDIKLLKIFNYYPDMFHWSRFYYGIPALIKDIGYSNVEHLFNENINEELKIIIDDKIKKEIIFPKKGYMFKYKNNVYILFSNFNQ